MMETKEDFLLNEFPKWKGRTIRGDVYHNYLKAEMYLKNRHALQKRGCGCEYASMGRQVDRLYDEWLKQYGKKK